jgi:hypothetical protein
MECNRVSLKILPILLVVLLSACQPALPTQEPRIETPALPAEPTTGTSDSLDSNATSEMAEFKMLPLPPINADSPFCETDPDNLLVPTCENGGVVISRTDDPRRMNLFFNREVAFPADGVSIQAEVISTPPEGLKLDQNQYGVYMIDRDGIYHAVRVSGQYLNFETWSLDEDLEVDSRYNRVFSPLLNPSGQSNFFNLACFESLCEVKINSHLAGRISEGTNGITFAGIFAAADWDQNFGRVIFNGLDYKEIDANLPDSQTFTLSDDLTSDHNTFSDRGLAGAFHSYQPDGFHFSPVVPFNFYSAATGPSLADISVEVTITMQIDPGVSGSQFAGVACRASQEGAYLAVIKVDGTYTLFRDTPKRPLAVLARKESDAILPGRESNRLRLDCRGDQIDFFINDTQVASVQDSRYNVSFGRAGLYTKAGSDPNENAIVFSDLLITELR